MKNSVLILICLLFLFGCGEEKVPPDDMEIVDWEEILPGHYIGELEVETDLNNWDYLQAFCVDDSKICHINSSKWDNYFNKAISLDLKKTTSGYEIILEKNQILQWDTMKLTDRPPPDPETRGYDPYFNSFGTIIDGIPDLFGSSVAIYENDSISLFFNFIYFMPSDSAKRVYFQATKSAP